MLDFLARYFWLVCLGLCALQVAGTMRARPGDALDGERRAFARWLALGGAIPWIVMGLGQIVGGVPSLSSFFRPQDGNPYVIAFLASILLVAVAFGVWVLAFDGARTVVRLESTDHSDRKSSLTEGRVKLFAVLLPIVMVGWMVFVVYSDAKVAR